ncbi:surE [Wigglesworthia glossinidia endosymbiont of Glossina brevipalpis]|uniref:5'/3'-nucleotidase SurE n=1 Tax=Wigglesworthia glossinidia brevipalpis TaxID=36870 RepID=SURE_WIGBR|nr:RecName: Full=5'/3'-nucleotidase SurE; AltName: Full=Exopolyphosphatase; AltName: Full=Nucleoside monophosphate phosphohydrolase [Wigglesworthia glossinidia endosymbiont of Glossina brevipalpis]BAC24453.1 surE [Wigglesworthia glossinidia endosymbiont of Glossina brevipalpis]
MNILLSNDDGIYSPGIQKLSKKLKKFLNVQVIAPSCDKSGSSSSLTINNPLKVHKFSNGDITVYSGTPIDCVYLGINFFMKPKPDFVVSGINLGANLGDDVFYSGTVGAAMEGRYLKYSSLAISLDGNKHLDVAVEIVYKFLKFLLNNPFRKKYILNINIPDSPLKYIKGFKITKCGRKNFKNTVIKSKDSENKNIFWIGPKTNCYNESIGTDFHAIKNNYISVTPLLSNLTNNKEINSISNWFENFYKS